MVDWDAELSQNPSSVMIPVRPLGQAQSPRLAVRQVLGISFPSLCLLLAGTHTAEEIETA